MSMDILTDNELAELRRIPSPTVANAIERFNCRDRHEGVTGPGVFCAFPEIGPLVGYAATLTVRSATTPSAKSASRQATWDSVLTVPGPRIVVAQELDQPPRGAFWGEVNASIHKALGCVGLLTDGTVRDLDEVKRIGFQFWAAGVEVAHGFAHAEAFGEPVTVFGMTVRPGDLIHADKHGAVVIPAKVAREVAAACRAVDDYERPMLELCRGGEFTTAKLAELLNVPTI
ncbi:MAG: RraA family protein [Gemmataceae bacterium]